MTAAVESDRLTKSFHGQIAVDHIDLDVPAGSVYGFLGPNGSGKTTTIRMLLGLIAPSEGRCSVLGRPMPEGATPTLARVGSLVEGPAFHPYLSGRANLERLDAADPYADPRTARRRIGAALDRVGLAAAARKRFRAYSLGMRQRLAIAATLLQPRDLLILDEPTNGLDPQGTREIRHLVAGLTDEGATVLVSSHLLAEVEQICSHVGVMHQGRLVAQGTIDSLRSAAAPTLSLTTPDATRALEVLAGAGVTGLHHEGTRVNGAPGGVRPEDLVAALVHGGVRVRRFELETPSLEDVFVGLTGEGFDVDH